MMKNQKHHLLFLLLAVVFLSLSSFDSHAAETDSACTLKVDGTDYYDYAFQVLELVNEQREAAGLGSLTMDSTLLDCAMQRAAELSVYFSHTRPDGRSCLTVMGDFNYTYRVMVAENIACGQASPDRVMTSWMNSDGHKANILHASASAIGIGCFRQSNGYYCWVQLFSGNTSISEAVKPADCDVTSTVSYAAGYLGNISVTPASSSLTAGDTTTLTVKLTNAGFSYCKTILQPDTLSFSSSAPEAISVDSSGKVKAISCGSAVITVTLPDGTRAESEILSKHITVTDKAVAPTCTKTGLTEGSHCSVCGKVIKAQTTVAAKGHSTVLKNASAATCTKEGRTGDKVCSVCGTVVEKGTAIPMKDHTAVTDKAVAATCTKTGLTEGSHCSVCGKVIKAQTTVAAKGHSTVLKNASAATCTKEGRTGDKVCSVCGTVVEKGTAIPMKDHTAVTDKAVAAACTKTGLTEGSHCSVCGKVIKAQTTVAAKGHSTVLKNASAATCTKEGCTGDKVCSVCGTVVEKGTAIPMKGHTAVTDKAVAATCTKTGLTEGSHCSVCGKVIKAQTTVAIKSHTVKTTVTKATTTKNGSIVKKCSVCGKSISKTTIYYPKTIKLSTTTYTYDGKVKKPAVTVKDSAGKTISSSNYTLTWSAGRKNVGKYSVKITFKGNYSSSVTKTFTIVPKKTAISSAVNVTGRKITVKWKKNATGSGYQIQYSTSSKFTGAKTITVSKNSTVSKTITNLTKSKKYYIRIRTYKTVSGKKYYSGWSSSKYVTIKK